MSTSREASSEGGAPYDWEHELKQRSALATPRDTARGLFFLSILEMVRTLEDEAALARCQEELGGQQIVAFFNYPVPMLLRLTAAAGRELSGRYGSPEEAMRALGRKATNDFLSSAVGNAVRVLAGRDIKRFLGNLQTVYRMTASYGERSVVWTGPRRGHILMRDCFMPLTYHEGVLQEVIERLGGRDVKVRGQQTAPLDATFDFSWE